jgi:subtilisin family serine protease
MKLKRHWILYLLNIPLIAAGTVPNRYIVQLSTEPVAPHVARAAGRGTGRLLLHSAAAEQQRVRIRAEQATARAAIGQAGGAVMGALENVTNALIVSIPDAKAAGLAGLPGVVSVHPVRTFHLLLDHALPLHHVPEAWSQVGITNAGAGARIALIDTGVDIGHPGFQDAGFTAPSGFPQADTTSDLAYTNNKVIVARSYASLFAQQDPDPSAADHVGHGTATAMAAGGVMNVGPLATISGVAPQAYIGSYKVFGTPGVNDSATETAILTAIDDAVSDGMDVISMSLGSDVAVRLDQDPEVQALDNVAAAGIIVVAAAGNNGPDPATVSSPAVAPSVIAVGASNNDRLFAGSLIASGGSPVLAIPGSGPNSATPISAPLADISTLDPSGQACSGLPSKSLQGAVALIVRGTCTFESKLNNAQAAGAAAAVVYDNVAGEDPFTMGVGAATLPAELISNQDGLALKQQLQGGLTVTLQFSLSPFYTNPAVIESFSAKGPSVDYSIKPDLVAVGANMYTAAQKLDPNGSIYNASGYSIEQGTSFSTPLVAGAAALVKAARPGLTSAQYRSLLVNSALAASLVPGTPARVQQGGAGILDLRGVLNATATAAPVSLSFGAGGGDVNTSQTLTIWNVGPVDDTFRLSVEQRDSSGPVPVLPFPTVQLAIGASATLAVQFQGSSLTPGEYEGYIDIQGTQTGVVTRVPYWYGVASSVPSHVTVLYSDSSDPVGSRVADAVVFRVTDASGLPVPSAQPVATVVSGGGRVMGIQSLDSQVPNALGLNVRMGIQPGANVFQIQVGDLAKLVTITGQ